MLPVGPAAAQSQYNWRVYRTADGLLDPVTSSVTSSPKGNVWVRYRILDEISTLNGFRIHHFPAPGNDGFKIHESRTGQLWSLSKEGLQLFLDGHWEKFPIPAIATEQRTNPLRVIDPIPVIPTRLNHALVLLPDQLAEFTARPPVWHPLLTSEETGIGPFVDMVAADNDGAWITAEHGVIRLTNPLRTLNENPERREFNAPLELGIANLKRPHPGRRTGITMIADSSLASHRVIVHFDGREWQVHDPGDLKVRHAWFQKTNEIWGVTIESLFRIAGNQVITVPEDRTPYYQDVALEEKGAFWLASTEGLLRYTPLPWQTPASLDSAPIPIHAVLEDDRRRLWFLGQDQLILYQAGRSQSIRLPGAGESSYPRDNDFMQVAPNRFLINNQNQLMQFDTERFAILPWQEPPGQYINLVGHNSENIPLLYCRPEPGVPDKPRLLLWSESGPLPGPELPAGWRNEDEVSVCTSVSTGDLWLLGSPGLYRRRDGQWRHFGLSDGYSGDRAQCLAELDNGTLWFGGLTRLIAFDGRYFHLVRDGFERINQIVQAGDGSVWVATSSALFRYHEGSWVGQNETEGLPGDVVYAFFEDSQRRLWAGTSRGVSRWIPEIDTDPPQTKINTRQSSFHLDQDKRIRMEFQGADKWKFTPVERLLYSYRVDNNAWSSFHPSTSVTLTNLSAGPHRFAVRTMDRSWNIEPIPEFVEFKVILPWTQDPRLISISIAGAVVILFFAGLAYNRHRQLKLSYARVEKIVEERTRQLEEANQELLHNQKMKALGTLTAGVAHDFNSLLSIIKGSIQIINNNLTNPEKIRTRIQRIGTVVDQGSHLVKAMLGFSRHDRRPSQPEDINAIIRNTLTLVADRLHPEIRIDFAPDQDLPCVPTSVEIVQQMLMNLIFNASDAMNHHGRIHIGTQFLRQPPAHCILSPSPHGPCLAISVRDNGCGIPAANRERIFEPFFTTKALSTRHGTGLGLSMIYEFARELGYGLRVESQEGKFSIFWIFIPVSEPVPSRPAKE